MAVRRFDFLDIPTLARYRRNVLSLDSARALTRGNPIGPAALLSYLNPRRFIFTAVASENGKTLIGQITQTGIDTAAHLNFFAPQESSEGLVVPLVETLTAEAGGWGTTHILAEVEESSPVYPSLRKAGFSMYAWQRIWKLAPGTEEPAGNLWRLVRSVDWPFVQSLHNQIVPAMLQPIETLSGQIEGLVCRDGEDLLAYVAVDAGPSGVWLKPLIPPDCNRILEMAGMLQGVGGRRRPVFICVRSYQAWLESALMDLGAEAGPQQAVMVKRLAMLAKAEQAVKSIEKVLVKPAAPVAHSAHGDEFQTKET